MRLSTHPFVVIGVDHYANRQRISERVEELALGPDSPDVAECRLRITHPVRRIDCELLWFPGSAASRLELVLQAIHPDENLPAELDEKLPGIEGVARFNAVLYWLGERAQISPRNSAFVLELL